MAVHPVQINRRDLTAEVSTLVTLKAYEVYCHVFAPQEEIVTGSCRGGFGAGELIGFLYAATFPKPEWRQRFNEAMVGMKGL